MTIAETVLLALGVGVVMVLACALAIYAAVTLLERVMLRIIERTQNALTIGSPVPHAVEISHEPDAEERVARLISEDTIARGMQSLRAIYDASGIPVEDEVLRAEATAMLAGVEPRAPFGLPRD